jgi:hypothetical protein
MQVSRADRDKVRSGRCLRNLFKEKLSGTGDHRTACPVLVRASYPVWLLEHQRDELIDRILGQYRTTYQLRS